MSIPAGDKTEKILEQVAHLIAKIEHPNTPEDERDMCRERADRLMFRYAIDEATLAAAKGANVRTKPSSSRVTVASLYDEHRQDLKRILEALASANRCRVFTEIDTERMEHGVMRNYVGHIVGFDADVRFVEMMYTSIHLTFASRINPKWDNSRTEGENIRALKEAGMKWEEIAKAGHFKWPDGGLIKRMYLRQCEADGVERVVTQRHSAYRASFAKAFFSHLRTRLWQMEKSRDEQVREYESETGSTGTALALSDRRAEVDAVFYEMFPATRPMTDEEFKAAQAKRREEQRREAEQRQAMLDAMTPAARARFLKKEREEAEKEQRQQDRWYKAYSREANKEAERTFDAHGAAAGQQAAASVDLTGGRGGVKGGSGKQLGN